MLIVCSSVGDKTEDESARCTHGRLIIYRIIGAHELWLRQILEKYIDRTEIGTSGEVAGQHRDAWAWRGICPSHQRVVSRIAGQKS